LLPAGEGRRSVAFDEPDRVESAVGAEWYGINSNDGVDGQRAVDVREQLVATVEVLDVQVGLQARWIDDQQDDVSTTAVDEIGDHLDLPRE